MKRLFFVFSFILVFLCSTSKILADNITLSSTSSSTVSTSSATSSTSDPWTQFWNWIFGLFTKTDYAISSDRNLTDINSDMNDYGDLNKKEELKDKHSFAGSRVTDSNSQTCLKGTVIKKTILETSGYDNSKISSCNNKDIKINDLAHYFVQINTPFYCNDENKTVDIGQDIIDKVKSTFTTDIPTDELPCYKKIYDDFYLTSKTTTEDSEENTKKIMNTPISNQYQDSNKSHTEIRKQLDQNFSPDGQSAGLAGLHPESWQNNPPDRGDLSNNSGSGSDPSFKGGHKQGLSQYGAQGRALSGQGYEEILKAYYGDVSLETKDFSTSKIQTTNETMDFENTYLMGIAEMPDGWNLEALKAQAVAARTYAYVYTQSLTKPICTDTYCQVFNPQHINNSPNWKKAVEETKGQILVDNTTKKPFSTMYSAWHQGQSISYSSSGHSTASVDDTQYEQKANVHY